MNYISSKINKKINSIIWSLASTGFVLLLLAILIVVTDFMLKLTIALFVLVVSYTFLFTAYKIWHLKKEFKDFL